MYVEQKHQQRIPSILGELFFLMEYRNQRISLAGGELFSLPENLHFILIINRQVLRSPPLYSGRRVPHTTLPSLPPLPPLPSPTSPARLALWHPHNLTTVADTELTWSVGSPFRLHSAHTMPCPSVGGAGACRVTLLSTTTLGTYISRYSAH